MYTKDLAFPVLYLNRAQGVIAVAKNARDLTRCTASALKDGWFKNLYCIDSIGRYLKVLKAQKIANDEPFWGLSLMHGRIIQVELELQEVKEASFGKLKNEILRLMESQPELWEALIDSEEFKGSVQKAESFSALMALFQE